MKAALLILLLACQVFAATAYHDDDHDDTPVVTLWARTPQVRKSGKSSSESTSDQRRTWANSSAPNSDADASQDKKPKKPKKPRKSRAGAPPPPREEQERLNALARERYHNRTPQQKANAKLNRKPPKNKQNQTYTREQQDRRNALNRQRRANRTPQQKAQDQLVAKERQKTRYRTREQKDRKNAQAKQRRADKTSQAKAKGSEAPEVRTLDESQARTNAGDKTRGPAKKQKDSFPSHSSASATSTSSEDSYAPPSKHPRRIQESPLDSVNRNAGGRTRGPAKKRKDSSPSHSSASSTSIPSEDAYAPPGKRPRRRQGSPSESVNRNASPDLGKDNHSNSQRSLGQQQPSSQLGLQQPSHQLDPQASQTAGRKRRREDLQGFGPPAPDPKPPTRQTESPSPTRTLIPPRKGPSLQEQYGQDFQRQLSGQSWPNTARLPSFQMPSVPPDSHVGFRWPATPRPFSMQTPSIPNITAASRLPNNQIRPVVPGSSGVFQQPPVPRPFPVQPPGSIPNRISAPHLPNTLSLQSSVPDSNVRFRWPFPPRPFSMQPPPMPHRPLGLIPPNASGSLTADRTSSPVLPVPPGSPIANQPPSPIRPIPPGSPLSDDEPYTGALGPPIPDRPHP